MLKISWMEKVTNKEVTVHAKETRSIDNDLAQEPQMALACSQARELSP